MNIFPVLRLLEPRGPFGSEGQGRCIVESSSSILSRPWRGHCRSLTLESQLRPSCRARRGSRCRRRGPSRCARRGRSCCRGVPPVPWRSCRRGTWCLSWRARLLTRCRRVVVVAVEEPCLARGEEGNPRCWSDRLRMLLIPFFF